MPGPGGFLCRLFQPNHPFLDVVDGVELDGMHHAARCEPDAAILHAIDRPNVLAVGSFYLHLLLDLRRANHGLALLLVPPRSAIGTAPALHRFPRRPFERIAPAPMVGNLASAPAGRRAQSPT